MPKATLTYDLPEEQTDFAMATHATDMWAVLDKLDNEFRSHLKYNSRPEWHSDTIEDVRKLLWEMRQEHGINFN